MAPKRSSVKKKKPPKGAGKAELDPKGSSKPVGSDSDAEDGINGLQIAVDRDDDEMDSTASNEVPCARASRSASVSSARGRSLSARRTSTPIKSEKEQINDYEKFRKERLTAAVPLSSNYNGPDHTAPNPPSGDGGLVEGRGFPTPNLGNYSQPPRSTAPYQGHEGKRDKLNVNEMRYSVRAQRETARSIFATMLGESEMRKEMPDVVADQLNANIDDKSARYTYPTLVSIDPATNNAVQIYQNECVGKVKLRKVRGKPAPWTYTDTCRDGCDQSYTVRHMHWDTVEQLVQADDDVVSTQSGLKAVRMGENGPTRVIPPCPEDKQSFIVRDRREVLNIHAQPMPEAMSSQVDDALDELVHAPQNMGLTFHFARCAVWDAGTKKEKRVLMAPYNRDVSINEALWGLTDFLQDGKFLWYISPLNSHCMIGPRPTTFGKELWAGGIIDIDHHLHLHPLPGFIVLTAEQIEGHRPFAFLNAASLQWVDRAEKIDHRQHALRGDLTKGYKYGDLGPLNIYSIDQEVLPELETKFCPEAERFRNVCLPKGMLITFVNAAVAFVTIAAKGREVCRARSELKKRYRELKNCGEELFGHAEAALDARLRAAYELYRLSRAEVIKAGCNLEYYIDNQCRLYTPTSEVSRALVQLTTIDTLTMTRSDMMLYDGRRSASRIRSRIRFEEWLRHNPSAALGLPMPANDHAYLWQLWSGILQASFVHLDVVMMAPLPQPPESTLKEGEVEWDPNQAAYLMGCARDRFEDAVRQWVGPRIEKLMGCAEINLPNERRVDLEYEHPPKFTYAERALHVKHPPCIAWRFELPDRWDEKAVFPSTAGKAHRTKWPELKTGTKRMVSEIISDVESYTDMFAACCIETERSDEWDPMNEAAWVSCAKQIDPDERPGILLGDDWQNLYEKLAKPFEEKKISRVNKYMTLEPAAPVTKDMTKEIEQRILDPFAWKHAPPIVDDGTRKRSLPPPLNWNGTGDVSMEELTLDMQRELNAVGIETYQPMVIGHREQVESVSESSVQDKLLPQESYDAFGDEPLPPSTASSQVSDDAMEQSANPVALPQRVRRTEEVDSHEAMDTQEPGEGDGKAESQQQQQQETSQPSKASKPSRSQPPRKAKGSTTGGDDADEEEDGEDNRSMDTDSRQGDVSVSNEREFFPAVSFNMSQEELLQLPTNKKWAKMPPNVHWNLLQFRPRLQNARAIWFGTEMPVKAKRTALDIDQFQHGRVAMIDPPVRLKAKVMAIVQNAWAENQQGWENRAVVNLTTRNRFEHLHEEHQAYPLAEMICQREARLALNSGLSVLMERPAEPRVWNPAPDAYGRVPPPPPTPRVKAMEALREHNSLTEAWRGLVAIQDCKPSGVWIDPRVRKLPHDRNFVYDNYMLLTDEEEANLRRVYQQIKETTERLKSTEQHCYLPVEGRSFFTESVILLREIANLLGEYGAMITTGRNRGIDVIDQAQKTEGNPQLIQQTLTEAEGHNARVKGDPELGIGVAQFVNYMSKEAGAEVKTIAVSTYKLQYKWWQVPHDTMKTADFRDPSDLLDDKVGWTLASCMMLLGVKAYKKLESMHTAPVAWHHAGFVLKAGEQLNDGTRPTKVAFIYRLSMVTARMRIDYDFTRQTGLLAEEGWLEEKHFQRITNRCDDEKINVNDIGRRTASGIGNVRYLPPWVIRKMTSLPFAPGLSGQYRPLKDADFRAIDTKPVGNPTLICDGCGVSLVQGAYKCHEYCLHREENHAFGVIMLKIWTQPALKRPLPEDDMRKQQERRIYAKRMQAAVDECMEVDGVLDVWEIARANNIDVNLLNEELAKRRAREGPGPAPQGQPATAQAPERNLDEIAAAMHFGAGVPVCSRCGSMTHDLSMCRASEQSRAAHSTRILDSVMRRIPKIPKKEPSEPVEEDWQVKAEKVMASGKAPRTEPVPEPTPSLAMSDPMMDALVKARVPSYRAVTSMNMPPQAASSASYTTSQRPQRSVKRERDPSDERTLAQSSQPGPSGLQAGGYRGAPPAFSRSLASADEFVVPAAPEPKRSKSKLKRPMVPPPQVGYAGFADFNQSYGGRPSSASSSTSSRVEHTPYQSFRDPYCPDIDVGCQHVVPPHGMEVPRGFDYVTTPGCSKARWRLRTCAERADWKESMHGFDPVRNELSRAVYENKGFIPFELRECAKRYAVLPDDAMKADRRVRCLYAKHGAIGRVEVFKKWSVNEKTRHKNFYSSPEYATLSKKWCLTCLCPGHYARECGRDKSGEEFKMCGYCGSGGHNREDCPLERGNVGCDQCGSFEHGRLMCGLNEPLTGDAVCSVRLNIYRAYARHFPRFHELESDWKSATEGTPPITSAEILRVCKVLGVHQGYY